MSVGLSIELFRFFKMMSRFRKTLMKPSLLLNPALSALDEPPKK